MSVLFLGPYKDFGPGHMLIYTLLLGLPIGAVAAVPPMLWSLFSRARRIFWPESPLLRVDRSKRRMPVWLRGALVAGTVWVAAFFLVSIRINYWSRLIAHWSILLASPVGAYGWFFAWGDMPSPRVDWFSSFYYQLIFSLIAHLCAGALAGAIFDLQLRSRAAQT